MLTSDKQRQNLEKHLRQCELRVDRIKEEIRDLNNELGIHAALLSIGRDEKLLTLLDRLRDDENLAREALEGGRSFFERHDVGLPSGVRVVTGARTDRGIEIRGVFHDDAGSQHEVVWSSQGGFETYPAVRGKGSLNLDLFYRAQRTQLSTEFTLSGSGFTPNGLVRLFIFMEPGRAVPNTPLGTLSADASGSFRRFHRAWYLPGDDPQTRNPAFIASDATVDQPAVEEVPSHYWYARL